MNCTDSSDSFLDLNRAEEDEEEREEYPASDCESSVTGPSPDPSQSFGNDLIKLPEGDRIHDLIKRRVISGLGSLDVHADVLSIHRNGFRGVLGQARFQSFQLFAKAVEQKHGGASNVKYAWYGGSSDEIREILEHGFGAPKNNGLYGRGVYLFPDDSPMECVRRTAFNGDGLRYLLLCRVILGKSEVVHPGSDQSCPSSRDLDSGIDVISFPKKYIVWSTHLNTHILPEFLVTVRAPVNFRTFVKVPDSLKKPSSPWMPFPALISALSNHLPARSMHLVFKYYKDHRDRRMSRNALIQHLRHIAGDQLLVHVIKAFREKMAKLGFNSQRTGAGAGRQQN